MTIPGTYRHFKGNHYEVLGTATHSETLEKLVVYTDTGLWVRPEAMFNEEVDGQPRFALQSSTSLWLLELKEFSAVLKEESTCIIPLHATNEADAIIEAQSLIDTQTTTAKLLRIQYVKNLK